ncbi:ABC transporter substrate-binding protein [Neobacillus vireti]|uniref:ABC transporter substrate-binding protein n=1 Tax=Neobacillus vireti TaxID=220686 RepID=UPI002FFF5B9F
MIRKKIVAVLTLVMLILAAVGCSKDQGASGKPSESGGKENLKPVTFSYYNAAQAGKDRNTNETVIGKELEKQTGVNFKVEYAVGDINTKIGTMIASGKYPDLLVPDAALPKILDAGAFIDLSDLIDKYAPNIKRVYGPYMNKMKDKDGKIYFLPMEAYQGYLPNPNIDQGAFWIQRAVLKDAGYPKIKTLDEYFNLIEQYQKNHPKVDGKSTIGFTALTYDWRFFALSNAPNHLAGYPNDGGVQVDMKTHEAKVYGNNEDTKRYFKKLNEINNKGLFDKESFVANYDEYLAKLTSGRVLGFFDYGWQIGQADTNLKNAGVDDKRYMALPIVFDKDTKDQYLDPPNFVSNRGIGITVSAKDPVRIIKYLDNMLKEDNQKLILWGIKGQTYDVNDKGRFVRTQDQINKTADDKFREDFGSKIYEWGWPRGNGLFSDGNAYEPRRQVEVAQLSYDEGDKKLLNAYGVKVFSDLFAKPDERPWYPAWGIQLEEGSKEQIFTQRQTDLEKKYFPKLVLASPSKFDSVWNEYVKQYNALDVKAYEKKMTTEVKKLIEMSKSNSK